MAAGRVRDGNIVPTVRPECLELAKAGKRLQGWMEKFGLSPRDRSKVSAIIGTQDGEWDDI